MKIEKRLEKGENVAIPNWSGILSQLMIYFEFKKHRLEEMSILKLMILRKKLYKPAFIFFLFFL